MGVGGNVIGRMGAARESAYFKLEQVLCTRCGDIAELQLTVPWQSALSSLSSTSAEVTSPLPDIFLMTCAARTSQEAELQRHRRRLVREGAIQELAGARLGGDVTHAATDSSANFEVCCRRSRCGSAGQPPHVSVLITISLILPHTLHSSSRLLMSCCWSELLLE